MSLWLQAALETLDEGDYEHLRVAILPRAPIRIPNCLVRELEFAERRCRDLSRDRLLPIRFLWLMAANEQRMFGPVPQSRARYHPEKLLELWQRASTESAYRQEREAEGFRFDTSEKAMELSEGWIYMGDRFVEDFIEIETVMGVELLFADPVSNEGRGAFRTYKQVRTAG